MKYSESNKPIVCMMTQSTCYKGTTIMTPKGVLWHSTGANNPALKRYVQPDDNAPDRKEMLALIGVNQYGNDWNHISRQAGLNAWIGKLANGEVASIQTMPWNYKPWGCGSGSKGSCNNGWMQFEICEDNLNNKSYFDAVYKEACELTAYYCKMYNLDPHGTVKYNGVDVPVILDHATSYKLKLGGNHGDVQHWLKKYGKTLDNVRDDVAALLAEDSPAKPTPTPIPTPEPKPAKELYRVRKSWKDAKSQVGAYSVLDNAKRQCDKAGSEYHVYDSKGNAIYPEEKTQSKPDASKVDTSAAVQKPTQNTQNKPTLRKGSNGDEVRLLQTELKRLGFDCKGIDGIYGANTQNAVIGLQRERGLSPDGICGPLTWAEVYAFAQYKVVITASALNIRSGPSTTSSVKGILRKNAIQTIVYEKNGWGKLINGAGWIALNYASKI